MQVKLASPSLAYLAALQQCKLSNIAPILSLGQASIGFVVLVLSTSVSKRTQGFGRVGEKHRI